jgi:tRNA pseudouridine synthase 10
MYLHAAGREDIDVRMLGTGRPFVFEIINPKKSISCEENI